MRILASWILRPRLLLVLFICSALGAAPAAQATLLSYSAILNGASEASPNGSPGTGTALVEIDDVANTMHLHVVFTGLEGTTTASHIHAPTAVPGTGTAGVATTTPTFANFPLGVTSGVYDNTLDLTQASSYNSSYITANGGTPTTAEAALIQSIIGDMAYLNIHTTVFPGGEIRGFLVPTSTPTLPTTWGRIKGLYH